MLLENCILAPSKKMGFKWLSEKFLYGFNIARNAINGQIRPKAEGWPNSTTGTSGSSSIHSIQGTADASQEVQISSKNSTDLRVASVGWV